MALKKSRNPAFLGKSFQESPTEKSGRFGANYEQDRVLAVSINFLQWGSRFCQEYFNANFCGTKFIHFKALGL